MGTGGSPLPSHHSQGPGAIRDRPRTGMEPTGLMLTAGPQLGVGHPIAAQEAEDRPRGVAGWARRLGKPRHRFASCGWIQAVLMAPEVGEPGSVVGDRLAPLCPSARSGGTGGRWQRPGDRGWW